VADIVVRKVKFDFPESLDDVFPGDDPVAECYLAAFSLTMPYLEPYLIRTYRAVADRITDPVLAEDVRGFIAQEAQHYRNHRQANDAIKAQLGPEVTAELEAIEADLDRDYRRFNAERSVRYNLVYAEGFEAMTCAWALTNFAEVAERGPGTPFGPWQELWAWHGAEEIEHRTVAFGVYHDLVGRYLYRVVGSVRSQWHYSRYIDRLQRVLLAARGLPRRPHLPPWSRAGWRRYLRTFRRDYDPARLEPDPLVAMVLANYTPG
jgi:predicted metal-dependent hydrolase